MRNERFKVGNGFDEVTLFFASLADVQAIERAVARAKRDVVKAGIIRAITIHGEFEVGPPNGWPSFRHVAGSSGTGWGEDDGDG